MSGGLESRTQEGRLKEWMLFSLHKKILHKRTWQKKKIETHQICKRREMREKVFFIHHRLDKVDLGLVQGNTSFQRKMYGEGIDDLKVSLSLQQVGLEEWMTSSADICP